MSSLKPIWPLLIALTLLLIGNAAFAQTAIYVDVAGIKGESTDKSHPNTIAASSFSFAVANTNGSSPKFSDITISKNVDRSSPLLLLGSAQGTNIATVNLYAQKSVGGTPTDYYVIKLTDVKVTSVAQSGSAGGAPIETVSFSYGKIEIDYTMFNGTQPNGTVVMTWDLTKNQ